MIRKTINILLSVTLRSPLANWVYRRIPGGNFIIGYWWGKVLAYRAFLHCQTADLMFLDRFRRNLYKITISLLDHYYHKKFEKLSLIMNALPAPKYVNNNIGAIFVIGTLGAGGAERQAVMTAIGLIQCGYNKLRFLCTNLQHESDRFFLPSLEEHGVLVAELNGGSRQDSIDIAYFISEVERLLPSSLNQVSEYIREFSVYPPSIVHLWMDEVNIKAGIAAAILRVPTIILGLRSLPPCNFDLHQPYMKEGYVWLFKQPGVKLVSNSYAGARAYEHWLGIPKGTIRVIYNGFNFNTALNQKRHSYSNNYRAVHGLSTTNPVIGTVIRLTEEKRPFLWLEIAAQIRRRCPDVQFLVIGDGPLRSELELRKQQDDLRGAVTFGGYEKNTLKAMAAMDIFLLTSRAEGLPNVLIEAQAIGVPVVTTNVGGAPETMLDRITGWVLESDDIHYVADLIANLIRDVKWRDRARLAMPAFVSDTFGMERMLHETITLYDK